MADDLKIRYCKKCNKKYPYWFFRKCLTGNKKPSYRSICKKCESLAAIENRKNCGYEIFKKRIDRLKKINNLYRMILKIRSWSRAFIVNKTCRNPEIELMLGCTYEEARKHIESQFKDGMSWINYGKNVWEIDHIIPICSVSTQEELYKLGHYTNLQPLWFYENSKKSKIEYTKTRKYKDNTVILKDSIAKTL